MCHDSNHYCIISMQLPLTTCYADQCLYSCIRAAHLDIPCVWSLLTMTRLLTCRILAVIFMTHGFSAYATNSSVGETKDIYLLCVCLDHFARVFHMSAMLDFSLEVVNNRSDIIPGYKLHIICGFSTTEVSFAITGPINSSNGTIWKFRCTRPHAL